MHTAFASPSGVAGRYYIGVRADAPFSSTPDGDAKATGSKTGADIGK
jgi:hypothetical protein